MGNSFHSCESRLLFIAGFTLTALAIVLRLVISWYSIGTNDAVTFESFATSINSYGLFYAYSISGAFNHPPLPLLMAQYSLWLAKALQWSFPFTYRLHSIAADAASCALLWHIVGRRYDQRTGCAAAIAFAWCLDALLVSGYHCNTDSIYAFFSLLAAYYIEERKPLRAGLALGVAINIKLIPVLLIAPLYTLCRNRRDTMWFTAGLELGFIPFIPPLLGASEGFIAHVLGYRSLVQPWGISFICDWLMPAAGWQDMGSTFLYHYFDYGRVIILLPIFALTLLAWRWRVWNAYELAVMTIALFFIFTPGFGVQYTVAIVPLLFCVNIAWGSLYGLLAGLYLLDVYRAFWTHSIPPYSVFNHHYPLSFASLFGLAAWGLLIYVVIALLISGKSRQDGTASQRRAVRRANCRRFRLFPAELRR
jgi:hypothetical protein